MLRAARFFQREGTVMQQKTDAIIKALAYFHRYGWIAALILTIELTDSLTAAGWFLLGFGIWTIAGYRLHWRHITCSFQEANHEPMTPHITSRHKIRQSDVYVVSALFLVGGLILIAMG